MAGHSLCGAEGWRKVGVKRKVRGGGGWRKRDEGEGSGWEGEKDSSVSLTWQVYHTTQWGETWRLRPEGTREEGQRATASQDTKCDDVSGMGWAFSFSVGAFVHSAGEMWWDELQVCSEGCWRWYNSMCRMWNTGTKHLRLYCWGLDSPEFDIMKWSLIEWIFQLGHTEHEGFTTSFTSDRFLLLCLLFKGLSCSHFPQGLHFSNS